MMTRLRVVSGTQAVRRHERESDLRTLFVRDDLLVQYSGAAPRTWTDRTGAEHILFGTPAGLRGADGSLSPTAVLESQSFNSRRDVDALEGRYVLLRPHRDGGCEIWTDRYGTVDLYCQTTADGVVVATGLDLLPIARTGSAVPPLSMAHALTVYGARPAKLDTLYAGVSRLGVDEAARVVSGRLEILDRPFQAISTAEFGAREHDEYVDAFLEAVSARASRHGNVVYLSSGWDSTAILAVLVHLFGARKVRAVIGRMRYSARSGVINQFELDRARAIAEFYNVPLETCEFDYAEGGAGIVDEVQPLFRAQQFSTSTGLNHWQLARHVARTSNGGEVVFAGEMSDGAHNLGFSQYVTIFHPVQEFREYSDKMASYLFGPTFLRLMQEGRHADDPVWRLFRERAGALQFDEPAEDPSARAGQLLSSFFLRASRLPLSSLANSRMLTASGQQAYGSEMENRYLSRAASEATPETLYSWYLHLYNSFHWQGSTVATLPQTAEAFGLECALPFHDAHIQEFLSAMPEAWGRGLDLKPTKYPLKWMLQHRIRYPMHLQTGPHSYLYDVDPTFSHAAELLFASSLTPVMRERLGCRDYREWLDADVFDVGYVEGVVDRYLAGEEFRGPEMNDLLTLAQLALTGRYGGS